MSAKLHVRSKNHLLGSSKSMESDAGVEMVIWRLWIIYQVFYTTMVCDDDLTIRAKLQMVL